MSNPRGNDPGYSGLPNEYKPQLGQNTSVAHSASSTNYEGYHDIDLLRQLLETLKNETSATSLKCQEILESYNLQTLTTSMQDAQKSDWPSDLGDPKDYISYHQYKAYENLDTRGAKYIRKAYEDTVRGPAGTCALDVDIISSKIQQEAIRIGDFLDGYIGTVDDSAEYRILEAFQDWAFTALKYARIYRGILDSKNEESAKIPEQDVTRLSQDEAKSFQALFKTKLNGFNDELIRTLDDIKKEFEFQDHFYDNFLGPGLKFRLNFSGNLTSSTVGGFFGNQADAAAKVFHEHLQSAVGDQIKRNELFERRFNELEVRIKARNAYVAYIKQLSTQGSPLRVPFVETTISQEERDGFKAYGEAAAATIAAKNTFKSSHFDLSDREADAAHPQYLKRAGDKITGHLDAEVGIKFDQVDVDEHRHKGKDIDNTWQIDGDDIVKASLPSNVVWEDEPVCTPVNLRLLNVATRVVPPGVTSVIGQIAWDTCNPKLMYEVEIVPMDEKAAPWWVDTLANLG